MIIFIIDYESVNLSLRSFKNLNIKLLRSKYFAK